MNDETRKAKPATEYQREIRCPVHNRLLGRYDARDGVTNEQEVLNAYNVHAIRADYNVDHSIPSGRIVGLNAVYDDVGRFLRYIVKK